MSKLPKNGVVCPWFVGMGFYTSDTGFAPESVWPGTKWQKLEGRFILAASSGHAVGETGGEESHKLKTDEMPRHSHKIVSMSWGGKGLNEEINHNYNFWVFDRNNNAPIDISYLQAAGGDQPHNNMPPYITRVYWERIE